MHAETALPAREPEETIVVQATVPLTPEFTYSIKKNSSISIEKSAFELGEEIHIAVRIAGGNDELLPRHKIRLQVVKGRGEDMTSIFGETGIDGSAHFSFVAGTEFLGDNIVRVVDETYALPIILHQEPSFIVYEPADDRDQRGKDAHNSFGGSETSVSGQMVLIAAETDRSRDMLQHSGTIVTVHLTGASARAGPAPPT